MKSINLFVSHYGGDEDKIDDVKSLLSKKDTKSGMDQ